MTEKLLGWDEFANSIFFCVAGAEVKNYNNIITIIASCTFVLFFSMLHI